MEMRPDQQITLQKRIDDGPPCLAELMAKLLTLGGQMLVVIPGIDAIAPVLIEFGRVTEGPILFKKMQDSMCHDNVDKLWKLQRYGIKFPFTGFALSDDGLWRLHSWGVTDTGIIETTEKRLKYFGIPTDGPK